MNRKPTEPERHAGIFQSYDEIPTRYRLSTYTQHYDGEDTLDKYYQEVYFPRYAPVSDSMRRRANRARDSWLEHMQSRDHHHALATPKDVDCWCQHLLEFCTAKTSYKAYFRRIYNFYDYLKTNYRHPHLYNPFLLAAIEYEPSFKIWNQRVKDRPNHKQS